MDMTMRVLTPAERLYTCKQSMQLTSQTGNIGYLWGDLGQNDSVALTTWEDSRRDLKTDAFKAELDEVLKALKTDDRFGRILSNRVTMADYCSASPSSSFGENSPEYGFRVDTGEYACLMRLDPYNKEKHLTMFCYYKEWLDHHIRNTERGIRFITPDYQELFRIPDGGKVRINRYDGEQLERVCRFIDDCHFEIGANKELFHICEFAEINARNGNTVEPLYAALPEQCFSILPKTGELVSIKRYRHGYEPCPKNRWPGKTARQSANILNAAHHITRAEEAAMLAGCTGGWDTPAADPNSYNQRGQLKGAKRKDRGDAR